MSLSAAASLNSYVVAMAVDDDYVYVGGAFTDAGGVAQADYVARWDGEHWSALGSDPTDTNGALDGTVESIAVRGGIVYVGGWFTDAAGIPHADHIARWDGAEWSAVGAGPPGAQGALDNAVMAIATAANGTVYVGGHFVDAAGIPQADRLVRWDGTSWSALGSDVTGRDGAIAQGYIETIALRAGKVYVGGWFDDAAGNVRADNLARWNGSRWSALGSGSRGGGAIDSGVRSIAFAPGYIYVGGQFTDAGGRAKADHVARWDGAAWSALRAAGRRGVPVRREVLSLVARGTSVYVAGYFSDAGGIPTADHVARWDGAAWRAIGSNAEGTDGAITAVIIALAVRQADDIHAGGEFVGADDPYRGFLGRWDGAAWSVVE